MSDSEKFITQINDGRQAQVCLNWLEPLLLDLEKNNVAQLKNAYRTGKYSEVVLASGIASLCTLEDLRHKLQAKIRAAEGAQKNIEQPSVEVGRPQYRFLEEGHHGEY